MQRQVKHQGSAAPAEEVKRLLSKAELRQIFLKSAHSDCLLPPHMIVPRDTQTFVSARAEYLSAEEVLLVLSKLILVGKSKKDGEKVFEFKQELGLVFQCECQSFDDETLKLFAEANGTYIAWPYHRELLHSTMVRMSVPIVLLPLLSPYRPLQPSTELAAKEKTLNRPARRRRKSKV